MLPPIEMENMVDAAVQVAIEGGMKKGERLTHRGLTFLQYTGLKDKNGTEIYEGDIVSYEVWTSFHEDCSNVGRVVDWNKEQCGWNPMCQHTVVDDGYYNYEIENVEVIGNIYENEELLTKK